MNSIKKKYFYCLMVTLLLFGITACGKEPGSEEASTQEVTTQEQTEATTEEITEETTEEVTEEATTEEITTEITQTESSKEASEQKELTTEIAVETGDITPEQAMELLAKTLGEKDEQTGNQYSFRHINTMTVDGSEYHVFMWGWYVDGHISRLTDMFVKVDGSAIYEGWFVEGATTIYTEKNYLE